MTNRLPRPRGLLLAFVVFLFLLVLSSYWFLYRPPSGASSPKVVFIRKGTPLKKASALLEQQGVIRSERFFTLFATLLPKKGEIKAGEYEFRPGMSPPEVLDTLIEGQVKRHLVTIVEGSTLAQIAQILEEQNIVEKKIFLEKATSPAFILSLGLFDAAPWALEGYLFPDTYHLIREMDPEDVIRVMVNQFKKAVGPELGEKAAALGLSRREVVVLASIIEKETSLPEEKPLISAVFHNRLRRRMALQSDPTVIYGIKQFNGNLTREHLVTPSPYNTYLIPGLPPTPICNPGKVSIRAALSPASVAYIYFVSKNDGSHFFSNDFEDHHKAVLRFQGAPRKNSLTKR